MWNLQNTARLMLTACLLLASMALTGCQQLSKTARSERVLEEDSLPHGATLGPSYDTEATELQPVPRHSTPSVPLLPPPAPPSDAARRDRLVPDAADDIDWDEEAVADADIEENLEEFFPSSASDLSRELLTQRAAETEARLSQAGRMASLRRAVEEDRLPVIVPGPVRLHPVPIKEPRLMPVPR